MIQNLVQCKQELMKMRCYAMDLFSEQLQKRFFLTATICVTASSLINVLLFWRWLF